MWSGLMERGAVREILSSKQFYLQGRLRIIVFIVTNLIYRSLRSDHYSVDMLIYYLLLTIDLSRRIPLNEILNR